MFSWLYSNAGISSKVWQRFSRFRKRHSKLTTLLLPSDSQPITHLQPSQINLTPHSPWENTSFSPTLSMIICTCAPAGKGSPFSRTTVSSAPRERLTGNFRNRPLRKYGTARAAPHQPAHQTVNQCVQYAASSFGTGVNLVLKHSP